MWDYFWALYSVLVICVFVFMPLLFLCVITVILGLPWCSDSKAPACNAGEPCSIPGLGRSPGEGNGNPLQYSCLESPMDRGAWWAPWALDRVTIPESAQPKTTLLYQRGESYL